MHFADEEAMQSDVIAHNIKDDNVVDAHESLIMMTNATIPTTTTKAPTY